MYVKNLSERLARYDEYWDKKNHDRPIIAVTSKKDDTAQIEFTYDGTIKERWWDTDYLIKKARASMSGTYYAGESLPSLFPNLGPDIFATFLGCELGYEDTTTYAIPNVKSWEGANFSFDENNVYWKKIAEMTDKMLSDSNGDYLVGVTDLHGGMDALVSLRGPEKLCMDLYDDPENVKIALNQVQDVFDIVIKKSYEMFNGRQKGYINWMGIYKSDEWYVSSSDFIYLISPDNFDEFSLASIKREACAIGNNIFHLDGIGSKRHAKKLLAMPEIHGVQWVYGAGQATAAHWIDFLKEIQAAGKLIEISCQYDDMKALFECGLKPEGVRYSLEVDNKEMADNVMKMAEDAYKKVRITKE